MQWNNHFNLEGKHAILGGSNYHWTGYDDGKMVQTYRNGQAKELGTELHDWAAEAIKLNRKQPRNQDTVNMYINDALKYDMRPEQKLSYDDTIAHGTADAIVFDEEKNLLRIHDLKTGETPADMRQLMIYAAFFCLEYGHDPNLIDIELRIYQSNQIVVYKPVPEEIIDIMNKTVHFTDLIWQIRRGEI